MSNNTRQAPLLSDKGEKWKYPSVKIIERIRDKADAGDPNKIAEQIEKGLLKHDIVVNIQEANIGATVTQYLGKITEGEIPENVNKLNEELAGDLLAYTVSVVVSADIPNVISIEVPNPKPAKVSLGEHLRKTKNDDKDELLSFTLGLNIDSKLVMCDLSKTPHILISGQTGSGKSMFFDCLLVNLLLKNSPDELRLIIIDPKVVGFKPYDDIPHLITPVINDPEHAEKAVQWALDEVERRYNYLAMHASRNTKEFNNKNKHESLPEILIVCDEIADLMMVNNKFYDDAFSKIAQKGRAVGVHLVIATSRPSTEIITDNIRDNLPVRIAFTTASEVDSKRIIDHPGAVNLLGKGDMYFKESEGRGLMRLQAPYLSDDDVSDLTDALRKQRTVKYVDLDVSSKTYSEDNDDELYTDALKYIIDEQKAGTAMLQMKFQIGYGRAARLIERLEEDGIVGPADGSAPREVYRSEY